MAHPKYHRLAIIAALLGWCCALVLFRIAKTNSHGFTFLLWNLFLAVIPLVPSAAVQSAKNRPLRWFCFGLWLLFLPNAPYILTDLAHLSHPDSLLGWYDLSLLLFSAGTGLILCYMSLADVQAVIETHHGKLAGWLSSIWVLFLCGFGIYMGRFLRFNSWEAFTNPMEVLNTLALLARDSGDLPNPLLVSLLFGTSLTLGYCALRVAGRPSGNRPAAI